tara:strand:- start:3548 stop:4186 length:639 start_codon:yes stop_codon:yes gene_type:complete
LIKLIKKKKLIIFDLDGVLIDSKNNMRFAWNSVKKKHNLNKSFYEYFNQIGKPFQDILETLGIEKKRKIIEDDFSKESINNFHKIKLYKNVKKILRLLNKKKEISTAIVTSKNKNRTKKIIELFDLKVDFIQCPERNLKGKPHPDQILKVIKKFKINKKNCFYIGDTIFDKQSAERSKIKFIFAKYGYKIGIKNYHLNIRKITELVDIINEK